MEVHRGLLNGLWWFHKVFEGFFYGFHRGFEGSYKDITPIMEDQIEKDMKHEKEMRLFCSHCIV